MRPTRENVFPETFAPWGNSVLKNPVTAATKLLVLRLHLTVAVCPCVSIVPPLRTILRSRLYWETNDIDMDGLVGLLLYVTARLLVELRTLGRMAR